MNATDKSDISNGQYDSNSLVWYMNMIYNQSKNRCVETPQVFLSSVKTTIVPYHWPGWSGVLD